MKKTLKRIMLPVLSESTIGIQKIMRVHNEEGNPMTRKNLSECISGVIESKMVKIASNSMKCPITVIPNTNQEPKYKLKVMHHIHASICSIRCLTF